MDTAQPAAGPSSNCHRTMDRSSPPPESSSMSLAFDASCCTMTVLTSCQCLLALILDALVDMPGTGDMPQQMLYNGCCGLHYYLSMYRWKYGFVVVVVVDTGVPAGGACSPHHIHNQITGDVENQIWGIPSSCTKSQPLTRLCFHDMVITLFSQCFN